MCYVAEYFNPPEFISASELTEKVPLDRKGKRRKCLKTNINFRVSLRNYWFLRLPTSVKMFSKNHDNLTSDLYDTCCTQQSCCLFYIASYEPEILYHTKTVIK